MNLTRANQIARCIAAFLFILFIPTLQSAEQSSEPNTLVTMQYVLNGRSVLDMPLSHVFMCVSFPPGAFNILLKSENLLIARNTIDNILELESVIDESNQTNGLNPKVNKHLVDLFPMMHFDSIEAGGQTFNDVFITEVSREEVKFRDTNSRRYSWPVEMFPESIQKQLSLYSAKFETFIAEQQKRSDAIIKRSKGSVVLFNSETDFKGKLLSTPADNVSASEVSISNQDIDPEFNGIPLSEILASGIVAKSRSPIYELSGGDAAFCEAADSIILKYSEAGSFAGAEFERKVAFRNLAKDAYPAKVLGYVRPGFLLKALNWKNTDSAAVFFPKNIGGMRFGAIRWSDFSMTGDNSTRRWWNDAPQDPLSAIPNTNIHTKFTPYSLTANSLLFDPFDSSGAILSNTDSIMSRAWIVQPADQSDNDSFTRNGGVLSVVETRDGLFLGYLSEKTESRVGQITWEQAASTNNAPYKLKVDSKVNLQPGSSIFSLFDADTKSQKRVPSNNPQDFLIFPETYSEILHKGTWALKTSLAIPNDSGFEPLQELENQSTFQYEIQKRLERIKILFDTLDNDKIYLLVTLEYKIREMERRTSVNSGESITAKPWRKMKEQLTSSIALFGDGAATFTDGERIYRIAADTLNKPKLTIYSVDRNRLSR